MCPSSQQQVALVWRLSGVPLTVFSYSSMSISYFPPKTLLSAWDERQRLLAAVNLLLVLQIANVGDYGLRVYNPVSKQHRILPVEVSLNGASFLVTVGKEAEQPPYRIDNRQALAACHLGSSNQ